MAKDKQYRSEIRDGMRIEWDVPIEMFCGLMFFARRERAGIRSS